MNIKDYDELGCLAHQVVYVARYTVTCNKKMYPVHIPQADKNVYLVRRVRVIMSVSPIQDNHTHYQVFCFMVKNLDGKRDLPRRINRLMVWVPKRALERNYPTHPHP
jgi:hypothetical protein